MGEQVWLKCENLQRTGSFKPRGAYNRIANLSVEDRARGVVAASAGNHAQGVAWAATELGIASTVFMPVNVPLPKLVATKAYGAQVHLIGETIDDALVAARESFGAARRGVDPPVRSRRHRRRPGHRRAGDPEADSECRNHRGADRRWRSGRRNCRGGALSGAAGPGDRSAGRERGGLAGFVGRRTARARGVDVDDGRRHRRGIARGDPVCPCQGIRRLGSDGQRRRAVARVVAVHGACETHRRTGRGGSGGR